MFLKSTDNLNRVFGILTRYSDWFVCWLEDEAPLSSPSSSSSSSSSSSPSSPSTPPPRHYMEIEPKTPVLPKPNPQPTNTENSPPPQTLRPSAKVLKSTVVVLRTFAIRLCPARRGPISVSCSSFVGATLQLHR